MQNLENSSTDQDIINLYLNKQTIRKLHIGCGKHFLEGWLNSDFFPKLDNVAHIDATKPYPFNDETFDFVFSEHTIEHVPYTKGLSMLKECFRRASAYKLV